jgi:hypothetical protein
LSAFDASFAAGLLEAATQCVADDRAVLLVAYDVQAVGALATVTQSDGLLAAAFILAPTPGAMTQASFEATLVSGPAAAAPLRSDAARAFSRNGMADVLPFLEGLARGPIVQLDLPLSRSLALRLRP